LDDKWREIQVQGKTILVVDDDYDIRQITDLTFQRVGAKVITAANGAEALRKFYAYKPELVILDIMMPGENGWDICREIRKLSDVPLIMITALHRDEEIIRSLDAGADDFITKPFSIDVLLARARAVLRRSHSSLDDPKPSSYEDGELQICLEKHQVFLHHQPVKLTPKEFKLLSYLLNHSERVSSFNQILENVWGWEYIDNPDYVHVYVSHLRQKIENDPKNPRYLITEHGMGYRFIKNNRANV
jgi:two-component system, OmpR family, KDP operon response regulator KdpE